MNPAFEQWQALLANDTMLIDSAERVLNGSDYARQWGERNPDRASALFASGDVQDAYILSGYESRLEMQLHDVIDEAGLQQQLRYFRQREMVRIIWRDLAGWHPHKTAFQCGHGLSLEQTQGERPQPLFENDDNVRGLYLRECGK